MRNIPQIQQESDIEWLQQNDEPLDEVVEKWNQTFLYRQRCKNIKNYFYTYKCLRSNFGLLLLSNDFDATHQESKNNFIENWGTVASTIVKYAALKKKLSCLEENLIAAEKEHIAAFLCLPKILGVIIRKRKSDCSLSTSADVIKSFFVHFKTFEELTDFKAKLQDFRSALPYVAFVGDLYNEGSTSEDTYVFVIINNLNFRIESNKIIEAFDYCYKAFFALNTDFTPECRHIWVFFQTYIYKNANKNTKTYTIVTKLIDELQKIDKNN